jgi:NADPH:quinone reductase
LPPHPAPETHVWSRQFGAHHIIDHRQPLARQLKAILPGGVNSVLALTKTEDHFGEIIESLVPKGAIGVIENVAMPLDSNKLKTVNVT